ncbi:MAG: CDP-diacylglycerol--glycerol-3-phosphate 3-phosphatidyltransferase [Oscillospiraceae bacterium]|nr:CDP-diacylglycerol--glycerol-3-phosphate 3-phosphatidyltransferase [Oscillospiraceae bacterium]
MNTPNKLTLARMILSPVFLLLMLVPLTHRYLFAAVVFLAASVTDFLDGKLARKHNQVTVLGKLTDPVADKMLITAALLAFLRLGWCDIWVVMIILTREFLVTSIRLVTGAQGVVIPANLWGKLKTASQMTFTAVILLLAEGRAWLGWFPEDGGFSFPLLSNALLWITAALTVISGVTYVVQGCKVIDFKK